MNDTDYSSFFTAPIGPSEDKDLTKQYIPPDYNKDDEDDSDPDDCSVNDSLEDEITERAINNAAQQSNLQNEYKSTQLVTPFNNPTSMWGNSGNSNNGNSMWGTQQNNNSSSFGSSWGKPSNNNAQPINRDKKVVFCDFLDCVVETTRSNKVPGMPIGDIWDIVPRFDIWEKIRAFSTERVYILVQINRIPMTNGAQRGWETTLNYFCCALSSFLRVPFTNCQMILYDDTKQRKEHVMEPIIKTIPNKADIISIGIYSGVNGQSNIDIRAAKVCNIDYIDLFTLMTMC